MASSILRALREPAGGLILLILFGLPLLLWPSH